MTFTVFVLAAPAGPAASAIVSIPAPHAAVIRVVHPRM